MPAKDGFGSYDGGKLVEHLAAEDLAFDGEPMESAVGAAAFPLTGQANGES
jgi:hypothetical protein